MGTCAYDRGQTGWKTHLMTSSAMSSAPGGLTTVCVMGFGPLRSSVNTSSALQHSPTHGQPATETYTRLPALQAEKTIAMAEAACLPAIFERLYLGGSDGGCWDKSLHSRTQAQKGRGVHNVTVCFLRQLVSC